MEGGWFKEGCRSEPWSVHVTEVADWLVLHDAQVVHGAAEGDLDGLADAGRASFHHFDLVDGLVHAERNHFGSRKPLPEEGVKQNQGLDVLFRYSVQDNVTLFFFFNKQESNPCHPL